MALKTNSNVYTLLFAIVMVLVVGSILAFVATALKPKITENQRIEKQQNILYAMGVNNNTGENDVIFVAKSKVSTLFKKHIVKQLVIEGAVAIPREDAYLIDLAKEENMAKDPKYIRKLPLFIGEKDGNTYYVLPMRGKGLWDAVWGYIALDKELTVQGVFFDHKGETPGLGANIKERFFLDDFKGEKIIDSQGNFSSINIAKGNNDPINKRKEDHKIDALSGATITGNGVKSMLENYISLYIPYLQTLKN